MFSPESSYEEINTAEWKKLLALGKDIENTDGKNTEEKLKEPVDQAKSKQVNVKTNGESITEKMPVEIQGGKTITDEHMSGTVDEKDIKKNNDNVEEEVNDKEKELDNMSKGTLQESLEKQLQDETTKTTDMVNDKVSKTYESYEEKTIKTINDGVKTTIDTELIGSESSTTKENNDDPQMEATSHHCAHTEVIDNDDVVIKMQDLGKERIVGEVTQATDEMKKSASELKRDINQKVVGENTEKQQQNKEDNVKTDPQDQTKEDESKSPEKATENPSEAQDPATKTTKHSPNKVKIDDNKTTGNKCCAVQQKKADKLSTQQRNAQLKSKQQEEEECCCILM